MAEKISINRKNTPDDNDLILKQRIKLLTSDYNNSANTIAVIDTNREFVFANNALLDAFQFSLLELKGKKISDLFHSVSSHNDIEWKTGIFDLNAHSITALNFCKMSGKALPLGCLMKKPCRLFMAMFENGFSSILISMIMPLRCFTSHTI